MYTLVSRINWIRFYRPFCGTSIQLIDIMLLRQKHMDDGTGIFGHIPATFPLKFIPPNLWIRSCVRERRDPNAGDSDDMRKRSKDIPHVEACAMDSAYTCEMSIHVKQSSIFWMEKHQQITMCRHYDFYFRNATPETIKYDEYEKKALCQYASTG